MPSPRLQRCLAWFRNQGGIAAKVEHWNHYAKRRMDVWGFDIIATLPDYTGTVYVQSTDAPRSLHDRATIAASPEAQILVGRGNHCWVMSVEKRGERGKRKEWSIHIYALQSDGEWHDLGTHAAPLARKAR